MNRVQHAGWVVQLGLPIFVCLFLAFTASATMCLSFSVMALFLGAAINLTIILWPRRRTGAHRYLTRERAPRKLKV